MGLLRVKGTIDVGQFWPKGTSDADTAVILVGVDAFHFQQSPGGPFKTTHAFEGALVHGRQGAKAPIDGQGRVRVRLQGIDAPELHYQPSPLGKSVKASLPKQVVDAYSALSHRYRQHWAESAAFALLEFVSQSGKQTIGCTVTTVVNEPTDVFDTYARLVGDIWIKQKNVNLWLVREGWVYPSFYDSMKPNEIKAVLKAWTTGKAKGRVAKALASTVGTLDFKLLYRSGAGMNVVSGTDKGSVLYPKIYRRLVTWSAEREAGVASSSFKQFVTSGGDKYLRLAEFSASGKNAKQYALATVLGAGGKCNLRPESTVFVEDPNSQLKKDNKIVHNWF
ncbi:MAG TPA: thermonuclease family protein [Burkholderiales bacterium]|nr:thermonuclease family protein [Burkholderiales bacterium]